MVFRLIIAALLLVFINFFYKPTKYIDALNEVEKKEFTLKWYNKYPEIYRYLYPKSNKDIIAPFRYFQIPFILEIYPQMPRWFKKKFPKEFIQNLHNENKNYYDFHYNPYNAE
jgi:hypothetical protein